jgi:hypothetical protein
MYCGKKYCASVACTQQTMTSLMCKKNHKPKKKKEKKGKRKKKRKKEKKNKE